MPPKKRARTSGGNAKTSMPAPETMDDVCEARVQLKNWVAEAYLGRHGFSTERKFPVNYGGSFLEIVQKCWEYDAFMDDSAAFLKKIGLVDSATETDAFLEKTCKMKVTMRLKRHGRSMDQT